MIRRFRQLSLVVEDDSQVVVCVDMAGIEPQGRGVMSRRRVEFPLVVMNHTQVVTCVGAVRIKPQRLGVMSSRRLELSLAGEDESQVVVCHPVFGGSVVQRHGSIRSPSRARSGTGPTSCGPDPGAPEAECDDADGTRASL